MTKIRSFFHLRMFSSTDTNMQTVLMKKKSTDTNMQSVLKKKLTKAVAIVVFFGNPLKIEILTRLTNSRFVKSKSLCFKFFSWSPHNSSIIKIFLFFSVPSLINFLIFLQFETIILKNVEKR